MKIEKIPGIRYSMQRLVERLKDMMNGEESRTRDLANLLEELSKYDDSFKADLEFIRSVIIPWPNTVDADHIHMEETKPYETVNIPEETTGEEPHVEEHVSTIPKCTLPILGGVDEDEENAQLKFTMTPDSPPDNIPIIVKQETPVQEKKNLRLTGVRKEDRLTPEKLKDKYPEAASFIILNKDLNKELPEMFNLFKTRHKESKCGKYNFNKLLKYFRGEGIKAEATEEAPKNEEAPADEEFVAHPEDPDIMVSKYGHVKIKRKNGEWMNTNPYMSRGKMVFNKGRLARLHLARTMLETFKPLTLAYNETRLTYVPSYKDGDASNCSLDNLSWEKAYPKISDTDVHEACQIIKENPNASINELLKIMSTCGKGVERTALVSILRGEYTHISEKYFILLNGKVNPIKTAEEKKIEIKKLIEESKLLDTSTDEKLDKVLKDSNGNIIGIFKETKDLPLAIRLFERKMALNMSLDSSDKIIPILQFIKDDNGKIRSSDDILKEIKYYYNKDFYILPSFILDIKQKRYRKDISDLVF